MKKNRVVSISVLMMGILLGRIGYAMQNEVDPCENAQNQMEMNECYSQQAKNADKELNSAYKKLMSIIDNKSKAKLKSAELAWIKYRDENCTFAAVDKEGGSIYQTVISVCVADMTRKRIVELNDFIKEKSQH